MGLSVLEMSQHKAGADAFPPNLTDDRDLVAAARRDPRAFGALYERYSALTAFGFGAALALLAALILMTVRTPRSP